MEQAKSTGSETLLDCIVIGAGPGGLQACIHLGRYNFRVLLFHSPGGRTYHAKHIENYLGRRSRFVIAASGARETLAPFKNLLRFFGTSYFTCMICDGYHTTGKKLLVIDRTINGVRLSVGMKQLFTKDVTFLSQGFTLAPAYAALLKEEGIGLVEGRPEELVGEKILEG